MLKKFSYITLFTFLGVLVSFLIHAVVEIPMIWLLIKDIDTYGLGLSLETWQLIHDVGTPLLLILGIVVGFRQGTYWWRVIYIEKRRG